jgi:hypothetical protein
MGNLEHSPDSASLGALLLRETHVRVVGVEQSSTRPAQVSWFQQCRVYTVDDVERTIGRAAVVYVLAGAAPQLRAQGQRRPARPGP